MLGTGDTIDVGSVFDAGQQVVRPGHSMLILMRPPETGEDEERAADDLERTVRA